jgi:hypothetical protein
VSLSSLSLPSSSSSSSSSSKEQQQQPRSPDDVQITFPPPDTFQAMSHTQLPLRALLFIKTRLGREEAFEQLAQDMFARFFTRGVHENMAGAAAVERVLREARRGGRSGDGPVRGIGSDNGSSGRRGLFSNDEIGDILAAVQGDDMRSLLRAQTDMATQKMGAFGLPWLWVTREDGQAEPFYGSDRMVDVCRFLGVPCRDVEILGRL